jgi:Ca2+-binding EF-hand superfamily protein
VLPGGPLVFDVFIQIDGRPQIEWAQEIAQEVGQLADQNHDGQVTWQEVTTSEQLVYGQLGNSRIENEDQRKQVVYRCDINRNGRMDADEVPIFLAAGDLSHWTNPVDSGGQTAESRSQLFDWLDVSRDQVLDASEIQQAQLRLRMFDRDDDGIVTLDDLSDRAVQRARTARSDGPARVLLLHSDSDWSRVLLVMEEQYAFGSPLQALDLPNRQDLFRALDTDASGTWEARELASLLDRPPDLEIHVAFSQADSAALRVEANRDAPFSVLSTTDKLTATVSLPDSELLLQSAGGHSGMPASEWTNLWQQWDKNQDDALDMAEYALAEPLLRMPLKALDGDGDGRVPQADALSSLRRRERYQQARVRIELADESRPVWTRLDQDRDGRLTDRELRTASARLSELGPTELRMGDFPATQQLRFVRAVSGDQPQATVAQPISDAGRADLPKWFEQMDQNRDGEIGAREFLGPAEVLHRLDRDADGALQADEITDVATDS